MSEIIVPIAAVPHGLFDAAIVLAENINDAKCYLIFGRIAALAGLGRVPKVWVAAELRGGGGSAIEGEYKQLKASGERLVLCLLDSDLRFPDCEPSAWRKRIIEHDEGVPSAYASAYPTGVYSVENLIPTEVITSLKTYAADASKVRALAEDAKHWRQHAALDHWGFIALKKGVGCRALRGEAGGGAYWQDRSQHFSGYSSKGCASPIANCRHDCLRLPAYPGDLLSTFVAEFEEANERSLTQVAVSIAPAVIAKFEEVVKRVVAWCCVGGAVGAAGAG